MGIIRQLSDELYNAKKEIGRMPDVYFVDGPITDRLRKEIDAQGRARGSRRDSRPLQVLNVPVKAFEFVSEGNWEAPNEDQVMREIYDTLERMFKHATR